MKPLIKKYDSDWPLQFEKLKAIFLSVLQSSRVEIEHIGSTSVPALAAKDIIDIDLIYYEQKDFEIIKQALITLDYYHNGDQGIAGREVFKRHSDEIRHEILDNIRHHLYVCHYTSNELKRHLLFRDQLRNSEQARVAYQMIKFEIARQVNNDRKAYAILKEKIAKPFIEDLTSKAANFVKK